MTARWTIVTPAPKTARCPQCLRTRNRLSIYPTPVGKHCYLCLTDQTLVVGAYETPTTRTAAKTPIVQPGAVRSVARPTVCPEPSCGRLPAHKGDHRPTFERRPTGTAVPYSYGG